MALNNTVTSIIINELTQSNLTKYELDKSTLDAYFSVEGVGSKFCGITYEVFSDSEATLSAKNVSIASKMVSSVTEVFMQIESNQAINKMIYLRAQTKELVSAIKPIFVSNCDKSGITFVDKSLANVLYSFESSSSSDF